MSDFSRRTMLRGVGGLGLASLIPGSLSQAGTASAATPVVTVPAKKIAPSLTTGIKYVSTIEKTHYTVTYDRVLCDPRDLKKQYPKGFDYWNFQGEKKFLDECVNDANGPFGCLINCDSWANVDGSGDYNNLAKLARPVNFQLNQGYVMQNFDVTYSELGADSNRRVMVMFKDGVLHHLNNTGQSVAEIEAYLDGKIEHGEAWSAGYLDYLVTYGQKMAVGKPGADGKYGKSAGTLLGQRLDGTIVIVVIYGKTGVFGASTPDRAQIMFNEGCYNAIVLDGGGSSQIYWNGKYVHPSSDALGKRALGGGYLALSGTMPAPVAAK